MLRLKSIRDPLERPGRIILRDAHPGFTVLNRRIAVFQDGGWDKNGAMSRELDGDIEVPKDQMTALRGIKLAKACDGTPAKAQGLEILVRNGTSIRPKVERHGAKTRILERSLKPRIPLLQLGQPPFAERMQVGGVIRENSYDVI